MERSETKRPIIITVEENGHERRWGLLSESNAWRAGSFWWEMEEKVKVFLEKDGTRKEVEVLKRFDRGREKVWLKERRPEAPRRKNPDHPKQQPEDGCDSVTEEAEDESVTEDDPVTEKRATGMSEDDPEEVET